MCAKVDRYQGIEELDARAVKLRASRVARSIDEAVNAAEAGVGLGHHSGDLRRHAHVAVHVLAVADRAGATKIVLLVSNGEQTVDAAPGKTLNQTALDAAALVKDLPATVFAWGFGDKVSLATLQQIATDPSKAILEQELADLCEYLDEIEEAI